MPADIRTLQTSIAERRNLGPGGRFALFDIMAGPNQPLHFPVPWASGPAFSFLLPPDEIHALVTAAGFTERAWLTGLQLQASFEQTGAPPLLPATPELSPAVLMGADAGLRSTWSTSRATSEKAAQPWAWASSSESSAIGTRNSGSG